MLKSNGWGANLLKLTNLQTDHSNQACSCYLKVTIQNSNTSHVQPAANISGQWLKATNKLKFNDNEKLLLAETDCKQKQRDAECTSCTDVTSRESNETKRWCCLPPAEGRNRRDKQAISLDLDVGPSSFKGELLPGVRLQRIKHWLQSNSKNKADLNTNWCPEELTKRGLPRSENSRNSQESKPHALKFCTTIHHGDARLLLKDHGPIRTQSPENEGKQARGGFSIWEENQSKLTARVESE